MIARTRPEALVPRPEDRQFIDLLMEGRTTAEASDQVYGNKRTGHNRLQVNVPMQEYAQRMRDKSETPKVAKAIRIKEFWTEVMENPEVDMGDRLKASALLAKHKGLLNDKVEVTHRVRLTGEQLKEKLAATAARLQMQGAKIPALIEDGRVVN